MTHDNCHKAVLIEDLLVMPNHIGLSCGSDNVIQKGGDQSESEDMIGNKRESVSLCL